MSSGGLVEALTTGPWDVQRDLFKPEFLEAYDTQAAVLKIGLSTLAFFVLFAFIRLFVVPRSVKSELRASWALKATSMIHSIIVAPTAIYALLYEPGMAEATQAVFRFDGEAGRVPLVHGTSGIGAWVICITLGYFVFDLALLPIWEGKFVQWIPMILHHGLSLLTWPPGVMHPACHWFLLVCVSMELSSPFVQLRWFIKQHAEKDGILYLLNGLLMTASFFACRIFIMPYNVWAIIDSAPHSETSGLPPHMRFFASFLILPNVLNLYWGYLMAKGLIAMGKSRKEKDAKAA